MILIIDNYDSFTYNIYQLVASLGFEAMVRRNDSISIDEIRRINPTHIILGPGPKTPLDSGICLQIVSELKEEYPILGICLGHQALLYAFGVKITNAKHIMHGKTSVITHVEDCIFSNIPQYIKAMRYHSLVAKREDIPDCFKIIATSDDDEVMAVAHKKYNMMGIQFHPESIGTEYGDRIMLNFIKRPVLIKTFLRKLVNLENLNFVEGYDLMESIAENQLSKAQIGSIITSFYIKKPVSAELAAFASVLVSKAKSFVVRDKARLDIVGTGGSDRKTFNVSTTAALLLASMGVRVAKHGNSAITSKSGSADLLAQLGININMDIETCRKCYENLGITFLFAPRIHKAMGNVQNVRKDLGFKGIFNFVGPLSNPLRPTHQLIGVSDSEYTEIMADALRILGAKRAMVVSGLDGIDEFSLCADTKVSELRDGQISTYIFSPEKIGISLANFNDLKGGDVYVNADITRMILSGKDRGVKSNLVSLNAGACLYLYGLADSIEEGFAKARDFIYTGKTMETLERFAYETQLK